MDVNFGLGILPLIAMHAGENSPKLELGTEVNTFLDRNTAQIQSPILAS